MGNRWRAGEVISGKVVVEESLTMVSRLEYGPRVQLHQCVRAGLEGILQEGKWVGGLWVGVGQWCLWRLWRVGRSGLGLPRADRDDLLLGP